MLFSAIAAEIGGASLLFSATSEMADSTCAATGAGFGDLLPFSLPFDLADF